MKITRKLQRMVENKIRHAVVTGRLHDVERPNAAGSPTRPDSDKADGNGMSQSR